MATRKELIVGVGQRYRTSSGKDKPKILEEFVRLTGYHRKHAIRVLNCSAAKPAPIDPNFKGWGRMLTDAEGRYRFRSILPGAYPNPGYDNWMRPPHIHYSIFAAGLMQRLITQLYFPGEPRNDIDPILNGIDDLDARASLIARRVGESGGEIAYEFDIVLRGAKETAFFVDG